MPPIQSDFTRPTFLPFALPDIDEAEVEEVAATIRSGWISSGPKVEQFEAEFAAFLGARHAVAVNSCTAAMHLALEALGLRAGNLVLTSPLTFAATAEVVRYFGATPLFVDVDPVTLNLDPARLAETCADLSRGGLAAQRRLPPQFSALTSQFSPSTFQVKAVMPVHLAGLACDMDSIESVAREHAAVIVEDAAHALPTRYQGRLLGAARLGAGVATLPVTPAGARRAQDTPGGASLAAGRSRAAKPSQNGFTCFSFYATKTLTTGEGGMIVTESDEWAERCRVMSLHGISNDAWKRSKAARAWHYEIIAPGFKYNLTDIAAAMGLAQLRKVNRMWERRQAIAQVYSAAFSQMPELQIPAHAPTAGQHAWQLYILRLNLDHLRLNRAEFMEALRARNIGASVHFIPLHLHPYYRDTYGYRPEDFPIANREYYRLVSLPIYSRMSEQDVLDVVHAVADIVEHNRV